MKIAICDDNVRDAEYLCTLCKQNLLKNDEITTFTDPVAFIQTQRQSHFDVLFLDVEMPVKDGITLGKEVRAEDGEIAIVFVTGYPQYAIDAFDCEAFHYLLKPCSADKFVSVLKKVRAQKNMHREYITLYERNTPIRIRISDIYYIECYRKHLYYYLSDQHVEVVSSLSDALIQLSQFGFYQIHQGYIVNFAKISRIDGYSIIMDNGQKVPISVRKKTEVLIAYSKFAENCL